MDSENGRPDAGNGQMKWKTAVPERNEAKWEGKVTFPMQNDGFENNLGLSHGGTRIFWTDWGSPDAGQRDLKTKSGRPDVGEDDLKTETGCPDAGCTE